MKATSVPSKPSALLVVLSLVTFSGCMGAKPTEDAWLNDKALVIQSLQDAHIESGKLRENIGKLDVRVVALERIASKQSAKIKALEATAQQTPAKRKAKKKKSRSTKPLKQRLDQLSAQLIIPAVIPDVKQSVGSEKNAYTAAYLALKSGRYDEASTGFSSVIQNHPKGEYTDQAHYWLGESFVAQRHFNKAIHAFNTVINDYPRGTKHAAALLKLATTYQSLNQLGDARAAFKRVIQQHPDSRTAERARVLLQNISPQSGATP